MERISANLRRTLGALGYHDVRISSFDPTQPFEEPLVVQAFAAFDIESNGTPRSVSFFTDGTLAVGISINGPVMTYSAQLVPDGKRRASYIIVLTDDRTTEDAYMSEQTRIRRLALADDASLPMVVLELARFEFGPTADTSWIDALGDVQLAIGWLIEHYIELPGDDPAEQLRVFDSITSAESDIALALEQLTERETPLSPPDWLPVRDEDQLTQAEWNFAKLLFERWQMELVRLVIPAVRRLYGATD